MRSDEPLTSAPLWYEVEHSTRASPEDATHVLAARVRGRVLAVDLAELHGGGVAVVEVGGG